MLVLGVEWGVPSVLDAESRLDRSFGTHVC